MANEDDTRATAPALAPYPTDRIMSLPVVEKGVGVPEKTPDDQPERVTAGAFDAVRETLPDDGEHTAYACDKVGAIIEAADGVRASAIACRSRGGGWLLQFLSEDLWLKLVTRADRPVVALPRTGEE